MSIDAKGRFADFGDFVDEVAPALRRKPIVRGSEGVYDTKLVTRARLQLGARFWFCALVLLPTMLAAIYYGLLASDQYVSEAQFIVRESSGGAGGFQPSDAGRTAFLAIKGTSMQGADDAVVVKDYILSRDAVHRLEKTDHLRELMNRPGTDFLTRFPLFPGMASFEHLYNAYQHIVDVEVDSDSGVVTLDVKGLSGADAHLLAASLVSYAEEIINRMNDREEQDAMALAHKEVAHAEERVIASETALTKFRFRQSLLDPSKSSDAMLDLVSKLTETLAGLNAQLYQLEKSSPSSPQIAPLRVQAKALQAQIDKVTTNMVGGDKSIAPKLSEYAQLSLQEGFAEKELTTALASMDEARIEAMRQHVYLEHLVEPNLPDYPLYPKTIKMVGMVFGISFLVFGMGWMLLASAREHLSS